MTLKEYKEKKMKDPAFAKAYDEKNPLPDGYFYRTTVEGAIGICFGAEYMTQWLFIPMEPSEERDALLQQLKEKMAQMEQQEQMELLFPPAASPTPTPQPTMKFCPNGGKPITPEMKFCASCGTRLIIN